MKPTTAQLQQLADAMYAELARHPDDTPVQRYLHPYAIVLRQINGSNHLNVAAIDHWPDLDEATPIAAALGVPVECADATCQMLTITLRGAPIRMRSMRYRWRDNDELAPNTTGGRQFSFAKL